MTDLPLDEVTAVLLDPSAGAGEVEDAAERLYEMFSRAAPVDAHTGDTALPSGKALSPSSAAQCARDFLRTAVYLRGVEQVLRERMPSECVYAGTGPFAPLVLPLMSRFPAVRFTLIDVHPQSIDSVRTLVERFGTRNCELVVTDATTYRHPRPIDLVIVETMQAALAKEPQVAVTRHFLPQLAPQGVLIPANVIVEAYLVDVAAETARACGGPLQPDARIRLGTVVDLRSGAFELTARVPDLASPERYSIAYFTRIEVYGEHRLGEYDSGLTYPKIVWDARPRGGETITFRFEEGRDPGIVLTGLSARPKTR